MSKKSTIPMFELAGPPCKAAGCSGVLVIMVNIKTGDGFEKCATCGEEFRRANVQPPCKVEGCLGVLEITVNTKTGDGFEKCVACGETLRTTGQGALVQR